MPSPFPGMNPYLEQPAAWEDFHNSYLFLLRDQLREQVRPAYFVKIEEYRFIHELPEERRRWGQTDLAVTAPTAPTFSGPAGAVLEAPAYGRLEPVVETERHAYLEIRDRQGHELITVIEVLSPSNKRPGPDRDQYLAKRRQFLASGANFVELDLLRGGPRLVEEGLPDCDYYAVVSRTEERPRVGIWPLRLRDRLPVIPVPLRAPSANARLDLQEALHRAYDSAGYGDYIYFGDPVPPLPPTDAAWAGQFVPRSDVSGNGAQGGSQVEGG